MSGEIDAAVQARVEDALQDAATSAGRRIVVDLSQVTFMDSGGLRLLYRAASASDEPPLLRGVPDHIDDLLQLTGVAPLFESAPAGPGGAR
ncbi:anti-sigma factor antagonist [Xylanimonas oleitrophica]|uniref:Anti-sigma factor antagonist n=2 Tax=Xylanimonas oleitrophica TaxID=2607479 RepID=A0A2W5WNY0_9MICO|nr:anti-sigma factor antagonist [Xylanimonas oleitrophica]